MDTFILNPYDVTLDLRDKEDRKIFKDGCKGLKETELFDGKKENIQNHMRETKKCLTRRKLFILIILTNYSATGSTCLQGYLCYMKLSLIYRFPLEDFNNSFPLLRFHFYSLRPDYVFGT